MRFLYGGYLTLTNKQGEHREVMFLIHNLEYVNKPDSDDYYYDYDGNRKIITETYGINTGYRYSQTILVYRTLMNLDCIYVFDKKLNLIKIKNYEDGTIEVPITKLLEEEMKNQLLEDVQLLLDLQKKPIINLQWLFNYLYGDNIYWRFSDMK